MKNDLKDIINEELLKAEIDKKAAGGMNFSAVLADKDSVTEYEAKKTRKRNKVIAWGTVAAAFLLVFALTLPAFKDMLKGSTPEIPKTSNEDLVHYTDKDIIPETPGAVILAHVGNEKKTIKYEEFDKELDQYALNNVRGLCPTGMTAFEMGIKLDEDITGEATVKSSVYVTYLFFNSIGPHGKVFEKEEKMLIENGEGAYGLSAVGIPFPKNCIRSFYVSVTYGDKTKSYAWLEPGNEGVTPLKEDDVLLKQIEWGADDHVVEVIADTGKSRYTVQTKEYSSQYPDATQSYPNDLPFKTFESEQTPNNITARSVDVLMYYSEADPVPNQKNIFLSVYDIYTDGRDEKQVSIDSVGQYVSVYSVGDMNVCGYRYTVPPIGEGAARAYSLTTWFGNDRRIFCWYENGVSEDLVWANDFDTQITSVDNSGLEAQVTPSANTGIEEFSDKQNYISTGSVSAAVKADIAFPENSTGDVTASLELYRIADSIVKTDVFTVEDKALLNKKTVIFEGIPFLSKGEMRCLVLTVSSCGKTEKYLWFEIGTEQSEKNEQDCFKPAFELDIDSFDAANALLEDKNISCLDGETDGYEAVKKFYTESYSSATASSEIVLNLVEDKTKLTRDALVHVTLDIYNIKKTADSCEAEKINTESDDFIAVGGCRGTLALTELPTVPTGYDRGYFLRVSANGAVKTYVWCESAVKLSDEMQFDADIIGINDEGSDGIYAQCIQTYGTENIYSSYGFGYKYHDEFKISIEFENVSRPGAVATLSIIDKASQSESVYTFDVSGKTEALVECKPELTGYESRICKLTVKNGDLEKSYTWFEEAETKQDLHVSFTSVRQGEERSFEKCIFNSTGDELWVKDQINEGDKITQSESIKFEIINTLTESRQARVTFKMYTMKEGDEAPTPAGTYTTEIQLVPGETAFGQVGNENLIKTDDGQYRAFVVCIETEDVSKAYQWAEYPED